MITLRAAPAPAAVVLPEACTVATLAETLKSTDDGGAPTLRWPTAKELTALVEQHAVFTRRPAHTDEKQWARILELRAIGGGVQGADAFESGDLQRYKNALAQRFLLPPRVWRGWGVADELLLYHYYNEMWPPYFVEYVELFWHLWLMEEIPDAEFTYAQGEEARDWFKKHGDWRGRASFFRKSWTHREGTMNFNHTAAMGALLGGAIIGAEHAMADGRHGLENFPLRHWSYQDGSGQEMLDHYYFSITVSGQKMFVDFGPTELDRLMGRMAMDHTLEMLACAYQPATRKCVGASGRARMPGILGIEQDGIYHPLHILANDPALLHTDQPYGAKKHDLPLWGYDYPPGRAALQSIAAPWHEPWFGNIIDRKPIPFTVSATDSGRGFFRPPLRKTIYHGQHHSLASMDLSSGTVPVTAQWTHRAERVDDSDQISTATLRYALNEINVTRTGGGHMGYQGSILTLQHRNKAVVFTKPRSEQENILKQIADEAKRREKPVEGLKRLSTVIALWSTRDDPGWTLYRNGEAVAMLPLKARANDVITLHDGVSYLGIIPLAATDLGRQDEVVIRAGEPGPLGDSHKMQPICAKLFIESFNLQRDTPLAEDDPLWDEITRYTYGGFVIETGDAAEYGSFDAFQKHMRDARAEVIYTRKGNGAGLDRIWQCRYFSGDDRIEFKTRTDYVTESPHGAIAPGQQSLALYERRVNGRSPFPPDGIDRDTTLSQQGTNGRLQKRGAQLLFEAGRTGYLLIDPVSKSTLASNPLPEESLFWALTTPEGVELLADGQLGLARVIVQPEQGRIAIDHALKEGERSAASARALAVFGIEQKPLVEHFGVPYDGEIARTTLDGKSAWIVPLRGKGYSAADRAALPQRIAAVRERLAKYTAAE